MATSNHHLAIALGAGVLAAGGVVGLMWAQSSSGPASVAKKTPQQKVRDQRKTLGKKIDSEDGSKYDGLRNHLGPAGGAAAEAAETAVNAGKAVVNNGIHTVQDSMKVFNDLAHGKPGDAFKDGLDIFKHTASTFYGIFKSGFNAVNDVFHPHKAAKKRIEKMEADNESAFDDIIKQQVDQRSAAGGDDDHLLWKPNDSERQQMANDVVNEHRAAVNRLKYAHDSKPTQKDVEAAAAEFKRDHSADVAKEYKSFERKAIISAEVERHGFDALPADIQKKLLDEEQSGQLSQAEFDKQAKVWMKFRQKVEERFAYWWKETYPHEPLPSDTTAYRSAVAGVVDFFRNVGYNEHARSHRNRLRQLIKDAVKKLHADGAAAAAAPSSKGK